MRLRTVIAAGVLAGALAAPATSRADTCAAAIRSGEVTNSTDNLKNGLAINSMLLRKNEHIQVFLPNGYLYSIAKAAAAMPEAERSGFVRGILMKNLETALNSVRDKRTAKFECAPLAEPIQPASAKNEAKPSKSGKQSKKGKKVKPAAPVAAEAPAKPAQKEDAKPQAPAGPPKPETQRGRTIRIPGS
ncbi:hypothetical protein H0O00_05030 [Candidatus Micrarchaeota archaeon]|nr:hypothetical protein [Candidatus Micrarchaeota archaeon]